MTLKPGSVGIVGPARRLAVALQDKVKAQLQRMEGRGVIKEPAFRYLGHVFATKGLRIDPEHVEDIFDMSEPKNASEQRLKNILAATNEDATLVKLRE